MRDTKKLYLVKLRGMKSNFNSTIYGFTYVVAKNTDTAYEMVKAYLDKEELGFSKERELESIELLAEEIPYPDCQTMLFIEGDIMP